MVKRLPASAGEEGLIPGSGRSSREYEMIPHSSSLFKKKKKIYFNWRIITLKYCGIFLIHGHESAMGAYVFLHSEPRSHLPPSFIPGLSQSTSSESPASCIQLALVISFIYGNIHVSMLFSQIIPPSPSPTYSKSLFFTSVSLLLPCV